MLNNYDKIARYYDFLSRIVFLNTQVKAQTIQLSDIPPYSKLLIAGGGSGWILEELSKLQPKNLSITYIEISTEMINLAKRRNIRHNKIEFINGALETFVTNQKYDVIHTAFFFDNFAKDRVDFVFRKLNDLLRPGGLWLYSDFSYQHQTDKKWKGIFLKLMYLFFNKIANVEATELIDTSVNFERAAYKKLKEREYYLKFIKAIIYIKQ
ncbi:ubiquinone/menaquinone biosynthesis C-methylase UbiE [Pedobacter sp. CG_S7]|uniref:class I SAM-dependent methyltransferase n=1 Tax=Pedobacter sp. CG_S7 TaxID=3143930 RepID=UPI003397A618